MAVVRFALYVDLMLLFGMPAFLLYNARETPECEGLFGSTLRVLAVVALALSVFGFALLCADMVGIALWELDRPTVGAILWQTPIGIAWIARMTALIIYLGLALFPLQHWITGRTLLLAAGAIALGSLAWNGHGAAGDWMRLAADIVHLLSAGLWAGALGSFGLLLMRNRGSLLWTNHLAAMLSRFALVGSLAVAAIVGSGAVNAWDLVGPEHVADLWRTPYGRVLTLKLMAFVAMLGLAALNRFGLAPQLERSLGNAHQGKAVASLRKSISIEATLALVVLALVAYLGLLEPPNIPA